MNGNNRRGLACFALGATAMYFWDPERGRRRRTLARDKLIGAWNDAEECVRKTAEYTRNQAAGLIAEAQSAIGPDNADDYVIRERVRSAMGRVVSHPRAVRVAAREGVVTLSGRVLARELDDLLRTAAQVRGVRDVVNELEVHKQPGTEPDLQGGGRRTDARYGIAQDNWSPSTRVLGTAGGTFLTLYGLTRRGLAGSALALPGAALLLRSLTNLPARRITGVGAGRRAVDVQKTLTIDAPIDRVFGFFSNYENFPSFMSNVHEVRAVDGGGQSHWVVAGPLGVEVAWDAILTDYALNERIAWKSIEGAAVENAGVIRFQEQHRGTRVDIRLSYNPPVGAVGHAVARLFGADPKSEMDADLARVKTALETGHPPRDAAQPLDRASARAPIGAA